VRNLPVFLKEICFGGEPRGKEIAEISSAKRQAHQNEHSEEGDMHRHLGAVPRSFIALALAVTTASGMAVWPAIAASAAQSSTVRTVIPAGSRTWIAGVYSLQSLCNQTGARGVRQKKWDNYICYATIDPKFGDILWVLSVTEDYDG
jgi:hypothetical protein